MNICPIRQFRESPFLQPYRSHCSHISSQSRLGMLQNSTIPERLSARRLLTPNGLDLSLLKDAVAFGRETAETAAWALLWEMVRRYNATYHVPPNGRWVFEKYDHWKAEAELFAQTILREWSGRDFSWLPKVKVDAYTHAPPRVGPVSDSTAGCMPWIKGKAALHVYKRWVFRQHLIVDGKDFAEGSNIRSLSPEEKRDSYCGPVFVLGIIPAPMQLTSLVVRPPRPPPPPPTDSSDDEFAEPVDRGTARRQAAEVEEYCRAALKHNAIIFQRFLLKPPPRFMIGARVPKKQSLPVETATVSTTHMVQPPVVSKDQQIGRSDDRTPMSVDREGTSVHSAARRAARAFFRGQIQATDSILSPPSSVGSSSVRSSSVGSSSFGSSPGRNGARTPVFKAGDTSYGPKMVHGRPSLPETPPSTPESSNHSSPASHPRRPTVNKLRPKASADTLEITNA